jgi:prolipoprotein diacylglyceryl transferase
MAGMNLLAAIPSPAKNGFYIGPLFFHAYGIAYVVGVALVILICRWRWRKLGGDPELPYEIAMWAFPAGLIGGRLYFDVTTPSQIPDHWWGFIAIWDGGLGIWGGVAGGVLVGLWVAHRRLTHAQLLQMMDVVGPALLVPQAIGRIGNYFNQELFGKPSSLPWALKISTSWSGTCWRSSSSTGWAAGARCARPACSGSTSPPTPGSGSSRRPSASTTPTTSSGCASTSGSP